MELSENSEFNCTNESKGNEDQKDNVSRTRFNISKRSSALKLDKSKKREYSGEMEASSEKTLHKVIKLSDCDDTPNDPNSGMDNSASKMSDENSSEGKDEERASSSATDDSVQVTADVSRNEKFRVLFEAEDLDVTSESIPSTSKEEKSSENKSSSSSSESTEEKLNSSNLIFGTKKTPSPESSDDSSSQETSTCGSSSSSSDFLSMFSDLEDEEEDDNFSLVSHEGINSEDEQNSETDDDKLPPVLRKTLPADKFSFPKEILLRQVNSGDAKRRHHSNFESKVYGSRRMVQRLELFKSLRKHTGCVNTLSFNDTGNVLISASDDKHVSLWNWAENKNLLHFNSGHIANVFQAKFLPHSNDRILISCGQDSHVRKCLLDGCGLKSTSLITKHDRAVHKIAMQPQMPNSFLTAGEDGVVNSIDARESYTFSTKLLKVLHGHRLNSMATVCLYSIHCNPVKNFEFIVGGSCEKIRLYDQRNISSKRQNPVKEFRVGCDSIDQGEEMLTTVTCAVYNHNGTEILASYNDNDVFLFNSNDPSKYAFRYDGHRNITTIKGVNFFGPQSEFVVSGSDCGYIYIWDKKSESVVQWMKGDKDIVNCLEPHPSFPVLATSGLDSDVKIWMPSSMEECEDITRKKEFQKVVKKNLYYKHNNTFTTDQAEVNFFYFLVNARRA